MEKETEIEKKAKEIISLETKLLQLNKEKTETEQKITDIMTSLSFDEAMSVDEYISKNFDNTKFL